MSKSRFGEPDIMGDIARIKEFYESMTRGMTSEPWREVGASGQPAFGTNWGNYGGNEETAAFYRDPLLVVRLKGMVTKTGTPAISDVIFTLPEGYRPPKSSYFAVATGQTNAVDGQVQIQTDGDVVWICGNTTEQDYTSFMGINFRVSS